MLCSHDFITVFPELFLTFGLFFLIIFSSFFSTKNISVLFSELNFFEFNFRASVILFIFSLFLLCNMPVDFHVSIFGFIIFDFGSFIIKFCILFFSIASFFVSFYYIKQSRFFTLEFFSLFHIGVLALLVLVSSYHFIAIYLCLELQALSFYVLASYKRTSAFSTESGVKYFIVGAFFSGIILFGLSLIYSATGALDFENLFIILQTSSCPINSLVFGFFILIFGFIFKLTIVPAHFWSIDVYEGSPTNISLFFSIVPKVAILFCTFRVSHFLFCNFIQYWQPFFVLMGVLSILIGSLSSVFQKKIKRFLSFSSISHMGYLLIPVSTGSIQGISGSFTYIVIYMFIGLISWGLLISGHRIDSSIRFISDLKQATLQNRAFSLCLVIVIFSMAGIPPLAGFGAKIFAFFSLIDSKIFLLSFILVFIATLGCYYYLRVLKLCFFDKEFFFKVNSKDETEVHFTYQSAFILSFCFFIINLLFIFPELLIIISYKVAISVLL